MFSSLSDAAGCIVNDVPTINCIPTLFNNVTNAFLLFAGVVSLFLIVWAGIRFITSGGDQKQVAAARQVLTYAIVGLIIVLSSFSIIFFISYITKASCITNFGLSSCQ